MNEIDKLSNNLYQMDGKFNNCRIDFDISQKNVARLSRIKGTCIETLNRVSETMELLTTAFVSRQNLSQNFSNQLFLSRKTMKNLETIITSKEEQINQLIKENQRLNDQIGKLNSSLSNITDDKQVLQNQLGHIQKDMDGLKSNTSRLMGENQGLEKVLNVKAELEGHKIEAAEKVLDLASKKGVKKIKIITDDEDLEDEDTSSNESVENDTKEIEKVVEKNIRKMAKNNKDKLKPILDVLSKTPSEVPDSETTLKENQGDRDGSSNDPTERKAVKSMMSEKSSNLLKENKMVTANQTFSISNNVKRNKTLVDSQSSQKENSSIEEAETPFVFKFNQFTAQNTTEPSNFTTPSLLPQVNHSADDNTRKQASIDSAMENTKNEIKKLKKFGEILKNASIEQKSNNADEENKNLLDEKGNTKNEAKMTAKQASHQIAKIVKELPNLVKV